MRRCQTRDPSPPCQLFDASPYIVHVGEVVLRRMSLDDSFLLPIGSTEIISFLLFSSHQLFSFPPFPFCSLHALNLSSHPSSPALPSPTPAVEKDPAHLSLNTPQTLCRTILSTASSFLSKEPNLSVRGSLGKYLALYGSSRSSIIRS